MRSAHSRDPGWNPRFYRCLVSFKQCTVTYLESHSKADGNNVLHVVPSLSRLFPSGQREHNPVTSFCTRTGIREITCDNKQHTGGKQSFGVRPLRKCHDRLCPCIYFNKAIQISYDSSTAAECLIKSPSITGSKHSRPRRASRSSSKSSSSSRNTPQKKTTGRKYYPSGSSGSRSSSSISRGSGSWDPEAAKIAGITVGTIVFIGILVCIIMYCVYKHKEENTIVDNTMAESPNEVEEEKIAESWNNSSGIPLSEIAHDSGKLRQNAETDWVQSSVGGDGDAVNKRSDVDEVMEAERYIARGEGDHLNNREF